MDLFDREFDVVLDAVEDVLEIRLLTDIKLKRTESERERGREQRELE